MSDTFYFRAGIAGHSFEEGLTPMKDSEVLTAMYDIYLKYRTVEPNILELMVDKVKSTYQFDQEILVHMLKLEIKREQNDR